MTFEEKKVILQSHPLCNGLDDEAITFLTKHAQTKNFQPQSIIVHQGERANFVYIIVKGLIKIYLIHESGKYIPVKTSGEREFIGDLGAIDGKLIPANVEAIQEVLALLIPKEIFIQALTKYPTFALNLLQSWANKVRAINQQRESSLNLKERTLSALKTLAQHFPDKTITLSQEELASIVGATRARVTEVLNELEKERNITHTKRTIIVL